MKRNKDPRGRKPVSDKIVRVDLFIRSSKVELIGKDTILSMCHKLIDRVFNKKIK
jgi:hypothetical protein